PRHRLVPCSAAPWPPGWTGWAPAPRVGGRGSHPSPGLVTVLSRAASSAVAKIRSLIQSTFSAFKQLSGVGHPTTQRCCLVKRFWTSAFTALVMIASLAVVSGYRISAAGHAGMAGTMTMAGNPQPMLTASTGDSFTPKMAPLPRTGWTLVASNHPGSHLSKTAIDGSQATFWLSLATPLPHHITINLHATRYVSALTYLPRQDTSSRGDIGRYSISVSMNGKNWGAPVATGTWADEKTMKTAVFGTVSTRYVRLTALTEAGNRGPYTSAADIGLLGGEPPTGPALSHIGWTASADHQASATYAASNVLDGDGLTMW